MSDGSGRFRAQAGLSLGGSRAREPAGHRRIECHLVNATLQAGPVED
jgi:hypothetical protein